MATSPDTPRVRRIVVAIDASPASRAAAEAAARLAAEARAEIEGVFIEDENLARFAALPFTRVVGALSGLSRDFGSAELRRTQRLQVARARAVLAEVAGSRVSWRFRIARGPLARELMLAAGGADLISLGFTAGARPRGAGSLARRAVREAPGPVLLLRTPLGPGAPVVVWLDGGDGDARALDYGLWLARAHGGALTVLIGPADEDTRRRIEVAAGRRLRAAGLASRIRHLEGDPESARRAALAAAHGGILVAGAALGGDSRVEALIKGCACSLLLMR